MASSAKKSSELPEIKLTKAESSVGLDDSEFHKAKVLNDGKGLFALDSFSMTDTR
jgi:hypothetical protein